MCEFRFWLPIDFLLQQSTLSDKMLVALVNDGKECVSIDLILSDIPVQDTLHLIRAAWPTQEAHHLRISIEYRQIIQIGVCQWPELQVFRLKNNHRFLTYIIKNAKVLLFCFQCLVHILTQRGCDISTSQAYGNRCRQ